MCGCTWSGGGLLDPALVDADFPAIVVEGPFDKRRLDPAFVAERESLVTRGWRRLREVSGLELSIIDYPLPEVRARLAGNP